MKDDHAEETHADGGYWTSARLGELARAPGCCGKIQVHQALNTSNRSLCRCLANTGCEAFRAHRATIVYVCVVWLLISQVFAIVAVVGVSHVTANVKNVPWATYKPSYLGTGGETCYQNIWMNLKHIVVEDECTYDGCACTGSFDDSLQDFAKSAYASSEVTDCRDASSAAVMGVILTCAFHVFSILGILVRIRADHGCNKFSVITGPAIMNGGFSLLALNTFGNKCYSSLPNNADASLGIGFYFCLVYCIGQLAFFLPLVCLLPAPLVPRDLEPAEEDAEQGHSPNSHAEEAQEDGTVVSMHTVAF